MGTRHEWCTQDGFVGGPIGHLPCLLPVNWLLTAMEHLVVVFLKGILMTHELTRLIEAARHRPFPPEEREAQRRSFAYGNTKIENDLITREMVEEQDELLKIELQAR
jgi:hypothetical protein